LRVELLRAVGVELPEADGEELHQLARVVLVRADRAARLHAVGEVEVHPHRSAQGHVAHQRAVVAEGVAREDLQVRDDHVGVRVLVERDDPHLAERIDDALAQLILSRARVVEERVDRVRPRRR
jgi:hypothetical protein